MRLFKFAIVFTLGFLVWPVWSLVDAVTAPAYKGPLSVKIENNTGMLITALRLEYKSIGTVGWVELSPLLDGRYQYAQFLLGGEGTYSFVARLEDGREIKCYGGYVENGWEREHRVTLMGCGSRGDERNESNFVLSSKP